MWCGVCGARRCARQCADHRSSSNLPDAHCPRLRELTINLLYYLTTDDRKAYESFIGRHASQLTAITLLEGSIKSLVNACGARPDASAPLFPQLLKLRQAAPSPVDENDAAIIRMHMPRLSELYVEAGGWVEDEVMPAVSAMLRNNHGTTYCFSPLFTEHISQNTSVRDLWLELNVTTRSLKGERLGAHLTALDLVEVSTEDLSALRDLTTLRSLSLRSLTSSAIDLASLPRSLRRLAIGLIVPFSGDVDKLLAQLAQHCAATCVVEVALLWSVEHTALARFVQCFERDGSVHRVGVYDQEAWVALRRQFRWVDIFHATRWLALGERRPPPAPFSWV